MMDFKYFTLDEFKCQETGTNRMEADFITKLDQLRETCGFSFTVTSGYRDPTHSIESKKPRGGTHTRGIAADILIESGDRRYKIIQEALKSGFTGIGVAKTFVHLDTREGTPVIWSY